ncbi:MAG: type I glutamate--ammonia ligase [Candidatus Dormibacter sp.]|uniref:type I glutamate--ammonia ligase n=1 Tax=Candidatus Dormibacter sp. TaxID=2973982 RepID=UPI000DB33BD5|nr:MAG: type I glutamate--ammonia ligase [Candidatus Dormibacteraeota bacterium]
MAIDVEAKRETSPRDVLQKARAAGVRVVDVRFVDLPGQWQHFSLPLSALDEEAFQEGLGFDGSSIRGFQAINESDMLLMPDPDTATIDPVLKVPTMFIICDVVDPVTREPYSRDPRFVAKKAESYLRQTGIADVSYFGAEAEFYIFNSLRFDQNANSGYYFIDSEEGIWNSGQDGGAPNLGYRPRFKEGYFPVPPTDKFQDLRSEIMLKLIDAGIDVEVQHHEVGTAGQAEIDLRFNSLTKSADTMLVYKYIVKNVCQQHGYVATFMPKPLFQDNGSGMHCHMSLWKDGETLMHDADQYAGLSDLSRWYIGGLLKHAPALLAFCAPTTNSYRRLVPGYEAPINLVYSQRNRSACVRIPAYSQSPKAKRLEFRSPDPSANPYLAFAAMLMAGLDGIQRKLEPPAPVDKDIYELEGEEKAAIANVPGSLGEALNALEADHEFLLQGDVFTADLIETWVEYKRKREVDQVALRPHPWEFFLYHDA